MKRFFEHIALHPDLGRALRSSVALAVPLLVCHALGQPGDALFIATAAQALSLPDLRGAYGMRLLILATMVLVMACSALLGAWAGGHIIAATLAMGLLALGSGLWRHLSADYGQPLGVSSALVFLLALSQPGTFSDGLHIAGLTLIGGLGAVVMHIMVWPFRPQHPLRYAVAETWVALSDLAAGMRPLRATGGDGRDSDSQNEVMTQSERELRLALDRTFVILGAAEGRQSSALLAHLEEMRLEAVHFAMRLIAFHAALEPLLRRPGLEWNLPTVDSVLKALGDAARSVAITLIMHRAENFSATEARLQRCLHLIQVLDEQLAAADATGGEAAHARAALEQIARELPRIGDALGATVDHAAARSRYPGRMPELGKRSVRSLAAWINPAPQPDPVLIRYALRMAVLAMGAVALYKGLSIPHGYWIAFTIIVVLQPDYGSTRQRAAERIGGTLAGSLLGSALLWVKMPLLLLDGLAALMAFAFAWFLKRRYGVAVFFVTLMLVLITETRAPVHLDFTVTRLLSNVVGGGVALISALVFWPIWEGEKFTALLAAAIRANRAYLEAIAAFLNAGADTDAVTAPRPQPLSSIDDLLMAKRRAENANRYASASLQRMLAEPAGHTENPARATALATCNQRLTRACTAIAVQLQEEPPPAAGADASSNTSQLSAAALAIGNALETMAQAVEQEGKSDAAIGAAPASTELTATVCGLKNLLAQAPLSADPTGVISPTTLVWTQLAKCITDLRAMALAYGDRSGILP